jgi:multidrug resistance efflux pump
MKRSQWIVVLLIGGLLTACDQSSSEATPTPSQPGAAIPAVVSASGKVLPVRWATLSYEAGGLITAVNVRAGDSVKQGDVLVQINEADAKLQIAQARAALTVAQAQVARAKAPPQTERVAVAEQAVKQAEAAVQGAQAQLAQLRTGPNQADLAAAQAAIAQAEAQLKVARDNYDKVTRCYEVPRENGGKDEVCPSLGSVEEQVRASVTSAEQSYQAAVARLNQLKSGATQQQINVARANIAAAQAQQAAAQAQLDLLKAGNLPEDIAVAEAGVTQAQVALDTATAQLAKLNITAPFDGIVGTAHVRSGELASAGMAAITIGEVSGLQVETTDLGEADVARVKVGAAAQITFDALPGKTLTGKVQRIAPMPAAGQAGVNYTVIIELAEVDPALRWGMTAFVDIQVD